MPPEKIIQPSEKKQENGEKHATNIVRPPDISEQSSAKVFSADELDKMATRRADVLIAQEKNKNTGDNLGDTSYVHSSTFGFGNPTPVNGSILGILKIRSYKFLFIITGLIAVVGLAIQYAVTGHVRIPVLEKFLRVLV